MIYVSGDWHGNANKISNKNWKTQAKEGDTLIQLGDFGIIWKNVAPKDEIYWMKWLSEKPYDIFVIPGNHENWDRIMDLPKVEKYGAEVYEYKIPEMTKPVWFSTRGEVYTIEHQKILSVPCALSIDKHLRREGTSWWAKELLTHKEETYILDTLDKHDWKVDYVLSHTCPDSVVYGFIDACSGKFRDPTSRFLEFVTNKLVFKANHFGHFHCDREYTDGSGDFYKCHYLNEPYALK